MVAESSTCEPELESSGNVVSRKPRNREVSSRYKTTLPVAPSKRFPSPNIGRLDATPLEAPKRAISAERKRDGDDSTRPNKELWSSGQNKVTENSRIIDHALKPAANGIRPRGGSPERKRRQNTDQAENARPLENVGKVELQKWPATAAKSVSKSIDLSFEREKSCRASSIGTRTNRCLAPARSFNQLVPQNKQEPQRKPKDAEDEQKEDTNRVGRLLEEAELTTCDDSDAYGSENDDTNSRRTVRTSTFPENSTVGLHQTVSRKHVRGTVVPARFWQDLGNRLRRLSDVNQLRSSMPEGEFVTGSKVPARKPKPSSSTVSTPTFSSPIRAPQPAPTPSSPSNTTKVSSPSRGLPSPTRARLIMPPNGVVRTGSSVACMLNFGPENLPRKKAMSQLEEAQYLRILHNRWLQWRFVNSRAESTSSNQNAAGQRMLYNAAMQISDLQRRVAEKRIKLQQASQQARVDSILASHGQLLEQWAEVEEEHSFALSGATEALEAGTLKVPITGGAKIDVQSLQDALSSAADAMVPLESTAQNLLPSVEKTSDIVSQLAQISAQGKALLQECGDLLDRVATLETEERSLRSYFVQLENEKRRSK